MFINKLNIECLRNLQSCALEDFATLNFFIGDNGAGKTSILEAISIASVGRSFRSNKIATVIQQDETALSVFLQCDDDDSIQHKIGISRNRKNSYEVRIDGASVKSLAQMSYILPVVTLDANAFSLLDGSSSLRRQFVDWGVFHVEHSFYQHWRQLQRSLKHRNSLLRAKNSNYQEYLAWDKEIAKHSLAIEKYRIAYLSLFQEALTETLEALDSGLLKQTIFYKNGWNNDKLDFADIANYNPEATFNEAEMLELLKKQFAKDLQYGRSHIGPHRADLQIRVNNNDVRDVYSRGQKKTLVAAMKLAQAKIVSRETLRRPVLLLDDLPSELDQQHLKQFLLHIIKEGYQAFITAVDQRSFTDISLENTQMFHVERGKITRLIAQGEAQE